jgi:hypothetical protein
MRSSFLAAVAVVIACRAPEPATFRYLSCCPGCETTTPMILGDEEDIVVTGSVPDFVSVESAAPSVVVGKTSRTCCPTGADAASTVCRVVALNDACESQETASLTVTVRGLAEGSSELRIKKSDGSVWGLVTLSVEKAAALGLACNTQGAVTLAQGEACTVTVKPTDANGSPLMSTQSIFLTSSDPTVVVFDGFLQLNQSGASLNGCPSLYDVDMFAKSPGDATVTATGGGATETLAVHVQ